jgi:hypothetical protein
MISIKFGPVPLAVEVEILEWLYKLPPTKRGKQSWRWKLHRVDVGVPIWNAPRAQISIGHTIVFVRRDEACLFKLKFRI